MSRAFCLLLCLSCSCHRAVLPPIFSYAEVAVAARCDLDSLPFPAGRGSLPLPFASFRHNWFVAHTFLLLRQTVFTPGFPQIVSLEISEFFMVRDSTNVPNIMRFEYATTRKEARFVFVLCQIWIFTPAAMFVWCPEWGPMRRWWWLFYPIFRFFSQRRLVPTLWRSWKPIVGHRINTPQHAEQRVNTPMQNCSQKVFNRGLYVCAEGLDIEKCIKTPLICSVSNFNFGVLGTLFGGGG